MPHPITSSLLTYLHTKSILLSTHLCLICMLLLPLFGLVSWDGAGDQIKDLVHTRQAFYHEYTPPILQNHLFIMYHVSDMVLGSLKR